METASVNDELYQFIVSDYYATGEGRTVCVLITRAYPWAEDYAEDETIKRSAKFRAAREFIVKFGRHAAEGAENLTREEFLDKVGHYLPEFVKNVLSDSDQPGNFNYAQEFHLNFS